VTVDNLNLWSSLSRLLIHCIGRLKACPTFNCFTLHLSESPDLAQPIKITEFYMNEGEPK